MKRIVLLLLVLGSYAAAEGTTTEPPPADVSPPADVALQCYECKIGLFHLCLTTKKMCDIGQKCYSAVGKAVAVVDVKMKGCLDTVKCQKGATLPSKFNSTGYSFNTTCCSTDLCNGGAALLPAARGLALATFTTLLIVLTMA